MLEFVEKIIDGFEIGPDKTRFGVIVYSSYSSIRISLSNMYNKVELKTTVRNLIYPGGGTGTDEAIDDMARQCNFSLY